MRCFIAIPCPDEVKKKLAVVQDEIKNFGSIKMVEKQNIHMTLNFLGDVEEPCIQKLSESLRLLDKCSSFAVTLKGVGVFPNTSYVRVVWAGVEDHAFTNDLQRKIEDSVTKLGFNREKDFHAHYTVARVRQLADKSGLKDYLRFNANRVFGSYTVEKVVLMESKLSPKGPSYSPVAEFKLRPP